MPKLGRTTPCAECPWLRKSRAGYLGDDNPEHFYRASITQEQPMPCHDQIDYTDPNWKETQLPEVDLCAGMLIHYRNQCKGPRRPEIAKAVKEVKPSKHVFTWVTDFFAHHQPDAEPEVIQRALWPFGEEDLDDASVDAGLRWTALLVVVSIGKGRRFRPVRARFMLGDNVSRERKSRLPIPRR